MVATPTTFDALVTQNTGNVRKALRGGVLWAPIATAIPASLTIDSPTTPGTPVLQALTGFSSLGCFTDDGAKFSRSVKDSTVTPWGFLDPARRDIVEDVTTCKITALETSKQVLAWYYGVDPATLLPDATTAELHIDKAASAQAVYFRMIVIGQDGAAGSEFWPARLLPRASVTNFDDIVFQSGDTAIMYGVEVTAYKDATAGYADRSIWCGPGWKTAQTAMGF